MFKGFSNRQGFNGVPNSNFGMNSFSAFGFSNVYYWLSAKFGLVSSNLGAINRWSPIVGSTIFEQVTAANQPRWRNDLVAYNGNPTVEFHDQNRFMTCIELLFNQESTIAIVANTYISGFLNIILSNVSPSFEIALGGGGGGPTVPYLFNGTVFGGGTITTNPIILVMTRLHIMINGVVVATNPNSSYIFQGRLVSMARRPGNASSNLNGNIAEIVIYNGVMDTTRMQQLSANLNQQYAIY